MSYNNFVIEDRFTTDIRTRNNRFQLADESKLHAVAHALCTRLRSDLQSNQIGLEKTRALPEELDNLFQSGIL